MEITKERWMQAKASNEDLILNNLVQIEMAKKVITLCDEKIEEFEAEEKLKEDFDESLDNEEEMSKE